MIHDQLTVDQDGVEIRERANEQQLIDFVFGSPFNVETSYTESRAIISPLNTDTMLINDLIYNQLPDNYFSNCVF